nr:hypothetical protein [Propionicimonas sp.]
MSTAVYGTRGSVGGPGSGGSLVVGPIDTATPFSGTRLLEDGAQLIGAIENRDWVSGALAGVSGVADAVSFALNPIAGLASMAVGWILDHLDPLKSWLNELTGDAGAVAGGAATWTNIAAALTTAGSDLQRSLTATLGAAQSQAVDAYKRLMSDVAAHLGMTNSLAAAISTGLNVAATIVQVVHDLVRDAIADVVGLAVSCIIPLPNVIADVIAKVAKWATRIGSKIDDLIRSFDRLQTLFRHTDNLLARLKGIFERVSRPMQRLSQWQDDFGRWLGRTMGGSYDPSRIYSMMDGVPHTTAFAPEQLSSTRISDDFLAANGITRDDLINLINKPVGNLTPAELSQLRSIRDALPPPDASTVLQKVVGQPYSDAHGNLHLGGADDYILGNNPKVDPTRVFGSVTVAGDTAQLGSPAELFHGLRLDYSGTQFSTGDASVHVIRFQATDPSHVTTSYGAQFGGVGPQTTWGPPYTGNGFTGASNVVAPEYIASGVGMVDGAEIWELTDTGTQRLVAVLRGDTWIPQGN